MRTVPMILSSAAAAWAMAVFLDPLAAAVLYSNGSIITAPTSGPGGFAASQYSSDFSTYGFSGNSPIRLADNFTLVGSDRWDIKSITVQGYVNASYSVPPVGSPLTGAAVRIWSGPPEAAGSSLLAQSNTVTSNTFSGVWRTPTSNTLEANRPVFDVTVDFGSVQLAPGAYWVDYSLSASGNPFSPMVMDVVSGIPKTRDGNAMRKSAADGDWVALFGGTGPQGLEFPFVVNGSVIVPEPATCATLFSAAPIILRRRARA